MASCIQCGNAIPRGQRTCSMCYGDIDHGRDNYYREYVENQQKDREPEQDWSDEER